MPVPMAASTIRRAIARWNKILERDEAATVETRARLMQAVEQRGLKYGDRPISTFLRPRFVDAKLADADRITLRYHLPQ